MPNWKEILDETRDAGNIYDVVRRSYLKDLFELTNRNVIVYYSGWLQKGALTDHGYSGFHIQDSDKNGFMATIHGMDRSLGLDLFLHTPGGDTAATESIVDYLRAMFGNDIRAVVPQLAMSAGTVISLACKQVVLGKHSSLGPIDPQIMGLPAHGIVEEFERASQDLEDPGKSILWQHIINKYHPTLLGECEKAIEWTNAMVKEWLIDGMFAGEETAESKADKIVEELSSHVLTKSHARHISLKKALEMGIEVFPLEDDQKLQELVLSVHHACIQTLSLTDACKIIENHEGLGYLDSFSPST